MPDIGYYTLPVIPSFRGTEARLSRDLNRTFGRAGTDAGRNLTRAASRTITADKSIEKATEAKAKSVDKLTQASSRLRAAQASLNAAESSGNIAGRARALEAVVQARNREAAAIRGVRSATSDLATATRDVRRRAEEEASGGGGGGNAGLAGLMLLGRGGASGLAAMSSTAGRAAGVAMKGGIAGVLTVAAGAAIAAPFFAAFKLFNWGAEVGLPLERTMNTLQGVTSATGTEMANAGRVARQLGSDINLSGVTASDAAAAMTELAKGGLDVNQAMQAARGTVQLATAGQLDAADAAKYQTAAMNMFGLSADKAGHVADLFAAAANASSADVSDLGMALQQGGSVAGGFGMSLEETMSVLTAFSKLGINASDAGTMMKTSLQAITDQGKPAQGAIEEMGLQLYDTQGKFVGYTEMMKQVAAASTHMTQEQFQAATAVLFGSDAMRASMIAAKGGPELFNGTADAMNNVDGAAARMAAAQMHGLPGVLEGLDNTVDAVKLTVYDAGNAIVTALGQQALGGLNGFAGWITEHQPQIVGFFTWIGTEAVDLIGQMASAVETGADVLAGIVNAVGDTMGAVVKAYGFSQEILGRKDKADAAYKQAESLFSMGDGLESVSRRAGEAEDKLTALKRTIQTAGDQANNASKLTVALGDAVANVPDGKDIVITNNSPETIDDLRAIGIEVEQTPTGLKMTATTDDAKRIVDDWRKQQGLEPVDIAVKPHIDPTAQTALDTWKRNLASPVQIPVAGSTAPYNPSGGAAGLILPPGVAPPRADGGVFASAAYAFGKMPSRPIIQPPTRGLVQWAEPSTHGEAFIPLNPGNRSRSTAIWQETGKRLGVRGFATGAVVGPDVLAAEAMMGTDYSQGSRTDCSGMVARVILGALGLPNQGLMSTKNAASWLAKLGFQPGTGGPGSISVGWYDHGPNPNDGHMAMTLTNGVNAEAGGSHGDFVLGGDAKGANSPGFDQHMFLPLQGLYPEGPPGSTTGFGAATGSGVGTGGGYVVDQEKVAKAQQDVTDADAKVAIQEQQISELKSDASQSQKMQAQDELRRAKVDAANARTDLQKAQQGEYKEGKSGDSSEPDMSDVGSIMSAFMKDTFGFGDWLPDLGQLGPLKMLNGIMGAFFKRGQPIFGGAAGGDATDPVSQAFGMAALGGAIPTALQPGDVIPPVPADGVHTGAGNAPGPVTIDNSTAVTVNGFSKNDVVNGVRRELQWAPRVATYTQPGTG